jgi:endoglucanase
MKKIILRKLLPRLNDLELKEIFNLIKVLTELPGPVGREELVQEFLSKEWEQQGFETDIDRVGNLYGRLAGDGAHWAIVSHADTIGFLVQQILSGGFLKMAFNTAATTPDARFLPGSTIQFLTPSDKNPIGYFGLRSGHIAGIEGKKEPVLFDDMFVDLGVNSIEEVEEMEIEIGTPAVFNSPIRLLHNNVAGHSMDNRVGAAIQTSLAHSLKNRPRKPNLTLISTVQEEIGMVGAAAAAESSDFDGVINVDVGLTGDIPPSKEDFIPTRLGAGPILVIKDFSVHYSHSLLTKFESKAMKASIPYQRAVFKNYKTDGMYFFMRGQPTITIGVPTRYTHTNFETINLADVLNTLDLIMAVISSS